ncbi:hypothetical protein FBU30_009234 [Linnemannia zychae]|nr:hypothetical protein FBU30_009234 [Linnemannia zychae]
MRTTTQLYRIYEPSFYADLTLEYSPEKINLFDSPYAINALSRNSHHVKSLKISAVDLAMLFNCMLAYVDKTWDPNMNPEYHRPFWLPMSDSDSMNILPVPPFANLEKLESVLVPGTCGYNCSYYIPSSDVPRTTLLQLSWIIGCSLRLEELKIKWLSITSIYNLKAFSRILSGLEHLHTLSLVLVVSHSNAWSQVGQTILGSCDVTTCALEIESQAPVALPQTLYEWNSSEEDEERTQMLVAPLKAGPRQLKDLTMWNMSSLGTECSLVYLLQNYPSLERLALSGFHGHVDSNVFGRALGKYCPNLRSLAFSGFATYADRDSPVKVMMVLPKRRIEEFEWRNSSYELGDADTKRMFQPHFEVLRKIVFKSCWDVESKAIRVILTKCPVLEHFQMEVNNQEQVWGAFVTLDDAVADPWVCLKLQFLELGVALPVLLEPSPGQSHWYKRKPVVELTPTEVEQLALLTRLYQQIGSLTDLRHLDLKAILPASQQLFYYSHLDSFPAMLNLDNEQLDRPGFLDLLQGLSKLEELCGTVNTNSKETKMTMGWDEARWMARHWPRLKVAEFARSKDELREPFKWLSAELQLQVEMDSPIR